MRNSDDAPLTDADKALDAYLDRVMDAVAWQLSCNRNDRQGGLRVGANHYRRRAFLCPASCPDPRERRKDVTSGVYASDGVYSVLPRSDASLPPSLSSADPGVSRVQRRA